jgi:hypothetical protein
MKHVRHFRPQTTGKANKKLAVSHLCVGYCHGFSLLPFLICAHGSVLGGHRAAVIDVLQHLVPERAVHHQERAVNAAVNNEPRMGASLLRLHFHDFFVDASPFSFLL